MDTKYVWIVRYYNFDGTEGKILRTGTSLIRCQDLVLKKLDKHMKTRTDLDKPDYQRKSSKTKITFYFGASDVYGQFDCVEYYTITRHKLED